MNLPQNVTYNIFYSIFCRIEHAVTVTYIWKVLNTVVIFFAAIVWLDQNLGELWNIVFFQCYDYLFLAAAKMLFLFLQSEVVARIVFPIFPSEMTFGRLPLALNHMHMGHLGLEEIISYRKAVKLEYCLPEICENTYNLACIWLSSFLWACPTLHYILQILI